MGGGHFDYQDKQLKNDMFGYEHEYKNPLKISLKRNGCVIKIIRKKC